jgi:hypothetical protein
VRNDLGPVGAPVADTTQLLGSLFEDPIFLFFIKRKEIKRAQQQINSKIKTKPNFENKKPGWTGRSHPDRPHIRPCGGTEKWSKTPYNTPQT